VAALAAGAGLAGLRAAWRGGAAFVRHEAGPVAVWVADRDGHELVGLDAELFVAARRPLRFPVEVEARADGGIWVLSAPRGGPLTPHRLSRFDSRGFVRRTAEVEVVLDLTTLDGGDALVVEGASAVPRNPGAAAPPTRRVLRVADDGSAGGVAEAIGARCVAGRGDRALVGTERGWALLFDLKRTGGPPPGALVRRWCGGELVDVAPGPRAGTWWALDGRASGEGRVLLLDRSLRTVWEAPLGFEAQHLAPVAGEERVWVAAAAEGRARRFGPGGAVEVASADVAMRGALRGVALPSGGLLLVSPGAVMRVDGSGQRLPGQGGFAFLVDLCVTRTVSDTNAITFGG
jgi:hypothetical protein